MKKTFIAMLAAGTLAVIGMGCSGESKVNTAKLQQEFGNASGEVKANVDKAVAAINAGNLREGIIALGLVISKSNDLSQAQFNAAGEAWTLANDLVMKTGGAATAAEAKKNADALKAQSGGSQ